MPVQIAPEREREGKGERGGNGDGDASPPPSLRPHSTYTQHECTYGGLRISPSSSSGEAEQWRTELLRSEVEGRREAALPAQTQMERGGAISKSEKGGGRDSLPPSTIPPEAASFFVTGGERIFPGELRIRRGRPFNMTPLRKIPPE